MRYLISVGRDKLRAKTLLDMWDICDREGSSMADEIWDALYTHVERYGRTRGGREARFKVYNLKDRVYIVVVL